MARRKLYGAALAAYNRKRGRSTALVRRSGGAISRSAPRTVTRYRTRVIRARRRRRSGGVSMGGSVGGVIAQLKAQLWDVGGAAGYGYLTGADTTTSVLWRRRTLDHLPTSEKLGKPLSHGIGLTVIAALMPRGGMLGMLRKGVGHLAHGALMRFGDNFGRSNFEFDAASKMAGDDGYDDDSEEFSGAMDEDYDDDAVDVSGNGLDDDDDPGEEASPG